jgi:hypothetical protein
MESILKEITLLKSKPLTQTNALKVLQTDLGYKTGDAPCKPVYTATVCVATCESSRSAYLPKDTAEQR